MRALLVILAAVALAALPASAAALQYRNPPGSSGINQYTEVVPTATGSTPTGSLSVPADAAAPRGAGAAALSRFVAATAPQRPAAGGPALHATAGESPIGSLAAGLSGGGGGMGLVLPLILGISIVVAAALLLMQRRRRRGS